MSRRHHYSRRSKEAYDIDVTTFLNLMVVLIPFLLITAVFSRITIVELNLPSSAGGAAQDEVNFRVEVIVRETGIELGNGTVTIATIPKIEDEFDLQTLSELLRALKAQYPTKEEASVLMESHIHYDYLIQVMDTVRSAEILLQRADGDGADPGAQDEPDEFALVVLFPEISVGSAP